MAVVFEKEGVNTLDGTGEILLTILSSLAQEESRNISENTRWGVVRRFEKGQVIVNHNKFMGYTKNDKGELYINQEQVDYDVNAYSIRYNENTDSIIYFIDWSSEKNYGTLKTYTKKDAQKIADDVYTYNVLPNGNVLYLYDYSQKYYHGDLYLWNKKDAEKLDDGVVCILPVS